MDQVNYKFGEDSTAEEVLSNVDLCGRLVALTGATAGIGIATAQALAAAGADLVIGARNPVKLESLLGELQDRGATGSLHGHPLDLMSFDSVDAFADAVLDLRRPLDVLINNAGIIGRLRRNANGIESQFMTNFVGHALLTSRLADALKQADGARLVSLTSFGHHYSPVVFDDLNFENRPYTAWQGYGQSKTAGVLLAVQVSAMLGIDAFAVHPGAIMTTLGEDLIPEDFALAEARGSVPSPRRVQDTGAGRGDDGLGSDGTPAYRPWAPLLGRLPNRRGTRAAQLSFRCDVLCLGPRKRHQALAATERLINRKLPLR